MLKGLSGAKWRATHQASVDGMLHDLNVRRPVKSFGSEFSNRDRWTGRGLFTAMNNRYYDGSWPLERILREANAEIPFQPHIVIAATPDDLPAGTALALVGGAYHEAWHTRYSRRTTLKREEIEAPLNERWGKADVKFWKFQHGVMLTWSNIIEDIRIERLGCARFPGALPKMEALQDLILKMEQEGFEKQMPENLLLTMIGCAFRDIGLGYDTPRQQIALAFYERVCPEAVAFVNGPLRPMLDKAINLPESADMEPIWMAMDIALLLRDLAEEQPQDAESEDESEGGEGGAPDADQDDSEGAGGGAPKPEQGDESKPEKGGGKGKPEKGEQGDESEGGASKPEQGEGDDSEGEGDDSEGEGDDADDGDADDGDSNDGKNAGGQSVLNDDQIRELAAALIESIANDAKMDVKDVSQALEQAINAAFNQDVEQGEMPWRSPCPEEDKVAYANVRDSKAGFAVRNKVRNEIAALRARLRNKFLAARTPSYTHGVRKGVDMSERRMVDSIIEINMGMEPTRPDYQKDKKNDCSLAVALVIDESGSMSGLRKDTVKGAVAIADALSSLGCPVLAIGPRNHSGYCAENASGCHRYQPVRIDVFKDWNESMTTALPRFPSITATGGTPLEDGIQYALQELNKRPERHRIVLTITDGVPDNPQVVRNQIRVSADAQIKIVGIGLGYAGDSVGHLFPEHLSVPKIENLPAMLASYLEGVMFPSRAKKIEGVAKSFKAA